MGAVTRRRFTQLILAGITVAWCLTALPLSAHGEDVPTTLDTDQLVARMVARNQQRARELGGYTSRRHYHLDYTGILGSRQADMVVQVLYHSPSDKEFSVVSQSGSKWICNHVLRRLMQVEQENSQSGEKEKTEISPANYTFQLLSTETGPDGTLYYVLQAEPKTDSTYLFRGKVWVEARDFAVARIEGEPAKNPSRWTKQSDFRHQYQCLDGFWLPAKNDTLTQLHLLGKSHLTIDYTDYQVTRTGTAATISTGSSLFRGEPEQGIRRGAGAK
ncbi:MAG TPA: hypothetical protein VMV61_08365 [Patescibacteria group bacterium]|nr:hypothetical protein [Patescibacteria group bacterium]